MDFNNILKLQQKIVTNGYENISKDEQREWRNCRSLIFSPSFWQNRTKYLEIFDLFFAEKIDINQFTKQFFNLRAKNLEQGRLKLKNLANEPDLEYNDETQSFYRLISDLHGIIDHNRDYMTASELRTCLEPFHVRLQFSCPTFEDMLGDKTYDHTFYGDNLINAFLIGNISNENFYKDKIFETITVTWVFHQLNFVDCSFEKSRFINVKFHNCSFENCQFKNIEIRKSEIKDCQFKNCQFSTFKFVKSQLLNVLFDGTQVENLTIKNSTLRDIKVNRMTNLKTVFKNDKLTIEKIPIQDYATFLNEFVT